MIDQWLERCYHSRFSFASSPVHIDVGVLEFFDELSEVVPDRRWEYSLPILGETKLGEMLSSQPQGLFI